LHYNKEDSYLSRLAKEKRTEKAEKHRRAVENLKKKREFKEKENEE
jgi:hypothetical protein